MSRCWELRGCDEEMQAECLHSTTFHDRCPAKCAFAVCDLPQHECSSDPAIVFDPVVDRSVAVKESCLYCSFFVRKGPRMSVSGREE